jgi:tetratricopeptide (TPR) repeat protein
MSHMKKLRFFSLFPRISLAHISRYAAGIIVCFYILSVSVSAAPMSSFADDELEGMLTPEELQELLQGVLSSAEQQIVSNYGQSQLSLLKQKIAQRYPLSQFPNPANPDDWGIEDNEITNQAGACFIVGIEATFKGYSLFAKWCFAKASMLAPTCPNYLSNLGFALNLGGEYETARLLLNHAKLLSPTMSSIWVNLGYGYYKQNMFDKATECFLIAFALNPSNEDHQSMLIQSFEQQGESSQADAMKLEQALEIMEEMEERTEEERETSSKKRPPRKRERSWPEIKSSSGSNDKAIAQFFAPALMNAANNFEEAALKHKEAANEYAPGSKFWNIHQVASTGWLMMADLCKGYTYDLTGQWPHTDITDQIADQAKKDIEELNKPPPTHNEWTVWLGPISLGKDSDGTYKLGISAGIIGAEFSVNPDTYNVGVKASVGPNLKFGLGPVAGEFGVEASFSCDLRQGPKAELTAKNAVSLGGQKIEGQHNLGSLQLANYF